MLLNGLSHILQTEHKLSKSDRVHLKYATLKYGVLQGSVLGPILFTMYTTPLGNIIRKHRLNFHLYADDTQLYISFQPGVSVSKETAIFCLEACIKDIKIWMTNNLLKMNDDKTELIVNTTHSNTSQNQHIGINIGDSLITCITEVYSRLGSAASAMISSMVRAIMLGRPCGQKMNDFPYEFLGRRSP